MGIPKYTYIPALRGGHEKSFDTFDDALRYVLSISTTDFVVDYLDDYLGKGFLLAIWLTLSLKQRKRISFLKAV